MIQLQLDMATTTLVLRILLEGVVLEAFLVVRILPIVMVDVDVFHCMFCGYVIFF